MSDAALPMVEVTVSGIRWQVRPECRELLFGPKGLRLEEWLDNGLAQVVKHGPHRTVYRVALPGLSFYLKHYRLPDARAWLRQLVRPAKARIEFDRAVAVAERQVPTISPVALGEGCPGSGPRDSFLITRSLEGAESISDFVDRIIPTYAPSERAKLHKGLAVALGEFVGGLHNAGILHQDLHAANLLIRLEPDGNIDLHLIDLHSVQLGRPLSWRATRSNLVMLNRWFIMRASRSERCRFWRSYCKTREAGDGSWPPGSARVLSPAACRNLLRELARDLELRTWQSNIRFWQHRDRRCLGENRYYHHIRSSGLAGQAVRDLDETDLNSLLADPDRPFLNKAAKLLKDSPSSTVAEFEMRVRGVPKRVIYKRFRVTSWLDPWLALARPTAAWRSWSHGHGLRERCLPTARPLAMFQRKHGPLTYEGYLLTEKIEGALELHRFADQLNSLAAPERRKTMRCRLEQVAYLVRGLHQRNLSHRDLKAGNVLVTATDAWLIDLVGMRSYRKLSRSRRVQNLARLHASFCRSPLLTRSDKLRFLRTYLQWGLFGRSGWKEWWRQIEQTTQAKIARNERNGRPLA